MSHGPVSGTIRTKGSRVEWTTIKGGQLRTARQSIRGRLQADRHLRPDSGLHKHMQGHNGIMRIFRFRKMVCPISVERVKAGACARHALISNPCLQACSPARLQARAGTFAAYISIATPRAHKRIVNVASSGPIVNLLLHLYQRKSVTQRVRKEGGGGHLLAQPAVLKQTASAPWTSNCLANVQPAPSFVTLTLKNLLLVLRLSPNPVCIRKG
ncbi:hypothetical protein J6590_048567 [Homalodisca vitripennis]|nr:hypothetical protein J6590_048567 [Homalodisca vitripennis]